MTWRTITGVWGAWAIVGLMHALSRYADIIKYNIDVPFAWTDAFYYVLSYSLWVGITLVLLRRMNGMSFPYSYRTTIVLFCVGLACWLPLYFCTDYAISTFQEGGSAADWLAKLTGASSGIIFFYAVVYGLTFTACLGITLAKKTRTAQSANAALLQKQTQDALALSEQKMQLMQSQLSPHFLFNCLGAISGLARSNQRDTLVDAIAKMGSLLRFTVANATSPLIKIDEELQFVTDYVALQSLRFNERFSYQSKVEIHDHSAMCPPFTLQPLVENAFRHAVENTDAQVLIFVEVTQQDDRIQISVCNTKVPLAEQHVSHGTGLNNLKARLNHLYNEAFTFEVSEESSRFCVKLNLPIEVKHDP